MKHLKQITGWLKGLAGLENGAKPPRLKIFLRAAGLAAAMALPGCIMSGSGRGALGLEHVIVSASEQEEETREREKKRRRGVSLKRSSGSPCSDNDECQDICEDVFNADDEDENDGKVRACSRSAEKYVLQFEEIVEYLDDPEHISELDLIDERAFKAMMDVSAGPWVDVTKTANEREAKILLTWIAKNKLAAEAINEAQENYEDYESYEGFKNLLIAVSKSGANNCDKYKSGIGEDRVTASNNADISAGKTFCQIAKAEANSNAGKIFVEVMSCSAGYGWAAHTCAANR